MIDTPPSTPVTVSPPPVTVPPKSTPSRLPLLLLLLLGVILLAFLPVLIERISYSRTRGEVRAITEALPQMNLKSLGKAFTLIYRKVKPSVVHIDTRRATRGTGDDFSRMLEGQGDGFESSGEASGVIVDDAGYIVTNLHVVDGATEITVYLDDGRSFKAEVIGVDPGIDLAVLKIDGGGLTAATWGDSDNLEVGEMVWAIGNPFGLDQTITAGIVSAKGRRGVGPSVYQEFLQTDVAVNPGNSGGPLVDIDGNVVGINTAIVGRVYQGISFAIPSNLAREVYENIRASGKVIRGYLGVGLAALTPDVAARLKYPLEIGTGALVLGVSPGSPAEAAGLERGDVIVEWNGQKVTDHKELTLIVARTPVGTKVPIKIVRMGEVMDLESTVAERPVQLR